MDRLRVTRERNALQAALKELKRTEVQELCRIHGISNTQRTKVALDAELVDHFFNEHTGRVLQVGKCNRGSSRLGSSTTTRPLVPQKRATEQSTLPAPKKVFSHESQTRSLQASTSKQDTDHRTIEQLRTTITALEGRVSALSDAKPVLTAEQVIDLIDSRLARQREDVQQALQELQELCETGFVNTQASFDAVGEWKEEVQQSFTKIQDWASAIEEKLTGPQAGQLKSGTSNSLREISHISSTPSAPGPSSWKTPAAPIIGTAPATRRLSRLSDALEHSLATIPEAPNTPGANDHRRAPYYDNAAPPQPALGESEAPMDTGKKQVRISATTEAVSPAGAGEAMQSPISLPETASRTSPAVSEISQALISFTPKQVTCTPRSAKTLFGTEQSAEARFDDILEVSDDSIALVTSVLPPSWTSMSPSRLLSGS